MKNGFKQISRDPFETFKHTEGEFQGWYKMHENTNGELETQQYPSPTLVLCLQNSCRVDGSWTQES